MRIPVLRGLIERRILVNYRIEPELLARLLPPPFRPNLVSGAGIAGICLIRLKQVRPAFVPGWLGLSSENAAHRIAVEWDENGTTRKGVYIPRRDTNSRWNALVGGRIFPGMHHRAEFTVREAAGRFDISVRSRDGQTTLAVRGCQAASLPHSSVFGSLEEASAFFEAGSVGYSATRDPSRFDGLELRCTGWRIEPLAVEEVHSSFFDDQARFPKGTTEFDCALLMRGISHEWHRRAHLCCPASQSLLTGAVARIH